MGETPTHQLVGTPPVGLEWLHAIKFDGYRTHARLAMATIEAQKAYLDGELCGVSTDDIT
jgi:ATP-dependent DNA ligase